MFDPPWRFDPFQNPKAVNWGGNIAVLTFRAPNESAGQEWWDYILLDTDCRIVQPGQPWVAANDSGGYELRLPTQEIYDANYIVWTGMPNYGNDGQGTYPFYGDVNYLINLPKIRKDFPGVDELEIELWARLHSAYTNPGSYALNVRFEFATLPVSKKIAGLVIDDGPFGHGEISAPLKTRTVLASKDHLLTGNGVDFDPTLLPFKLIYRYVDDPTLAMPLARAEFL